MNFTDGDENIDPQQSFNSASAGGKGMELERLKEALRKAVLGQQEAVDRIASTVLTGPTGAGKTDATLKAMAKAGKKVTVVNPEDFKNGAMDLAAGRIFTIDEIHLKSDQEIQDAIDVFMGRPTRGQLGEMAAEACRSGTESPVTCMKPLRYKRGFLSASMGF